MIVVEDSRIEWDVLGRECSGMAKLFASAAQAYGYGYGYCWWYYAVPPGDCHTPGKEL